MVGTALHPKAIGFTAGDSTMTVYGDLTAFFCRKNQDNITTLDVSNNTELTTLSCYNNAISSLDVSKLTSRGRRSPGLLRSRRHHLHRRPQRMLRTRTTTPTTRILRCGQGSGGDSGDGGEQEQIVHQSVWLDSERGPRGGGTVARGRIQNKGRGAVGVQEC